VNDRLIIEFNPAEGALLRMLGLIERRGYMLRGVAMNERPKGASLVVELEPRDVSRRIHVVAEQLRRLVDVNSVSLATPGAGPIA